MYTSAPLPVTFVTGTVPKPVLASQPSVVPNSKFGSTGADMDDAVATRHSYSLPTSYASAVPPAGSVYVWLALTLFRSRLVQVGEPASRT